MKKLELPRKEEKTMKDQLIYVKPTSYQNIWDPQDSLDGVPLRPIVDYIGSITYTVAGSVADILYLMIGQTEHHVKKL